MTVVNRPTHPCATWHGVDLTLPTRTPYIYFRQVGMVGHLPDCHTGFVDLSRHFRDYFTSSRLDICPSAFASSRLPHYISHRGYCRALPRITLLHSIWFPSAANITYAGWVLQTSTLL